MREQEQLLRLAFAVGAVTDALALLPMLCSPIARLLRGFDDPSGAYRFAFGYGASLMAGWTALLIWAYRRPLDRRFVAALTVVVVYGLILTEAAAVVSGTIAAWRMIPTWVLQACLLSLFSSAYHYEALANRWGHRPRLN